MTASPGRARRHALAALALTATACALAACGNSVPPSGVAKVGDSVIERSEFDHWLRTAAASQQQSPDGEPRPVVVPDPPNFTRCVADRQKQPAPKGATKPAPAQLKQQCKQEFDSLKDQVMQFLIQAEWVQQEAESRDVTVSDQEVRKQFEDQKKQAFPNDKAYRDFLKTSGQTEQDILFRVRLDALQNKIRQKVTEDKGEVTDADVKDYYDKNRRRFAQPEQRDLRVVLTKTEKKAKQARAQLQDGRSWKAVARRFSIDEASKAQGGRLPDVAKGQQEQALDTAVFGAAKGKLTGPVKTQFGWYVFEVEKITPAKQQSLEETSETIKSLLRSQREQKALDDFVKDFRDKYKDETNCREGFVVAECKNAPKEKTGTGAAPGGAPQGAPPQGAPPQGAPPQGAPPQGVPPQGAPPQGVPPQGAPPQGAPPQGVPPGG